MRPTNQIKFWFLVGEKPGEKPLRAEYRTDKQLNADSWLILVMIMMITERIVPI